MKILSFLIVLLSEIASAQILDISVGDLRIVNYSDKQVVKDYLNRGNRIVYLSSARTDSALFELINQYRGRSSLKQLRHSVRLDTLANMVARKNAEIGHMTHYNQFPELKGVCDLLNIENLIYFFSSQYLNRTSFSTDSTSTDLVDLKAILVGWINSPKHNRNMLYDFDVGTAKVLLKITKSDGLYQIETFAVFENDHSYSKRELDEKYRKLDYNLVHRKPHR